jgi:hypothetical protein
MSSQLNLPYRVREGKSGEAAKGWARSSVQLARHTHPLPPSCKREGER